MRRSFRSSSNGTSKSKPRFSNEPLVHKTLWNYGRLKKLDAGCKKAAVICVKLRKDIFDPRCGKQVRRFPRLWNLPLMHTDVSRLPFWFGELMQDKRITSIFVFSFLSIDICAEKKLILLLSTSCPLIRVFFKSARKRLGLCSPRFSQRGKTEAAQKIGWSPDSLRSTRFLANFLLLFLVPTKPVKKIFAWH